MHLSPYAIRNKKNFRILASRKKHLRAFAQQVFQTFVLNNRLYPEFKALCRKQLR